MKIPTFKIGSQALPSTLMSFSSKREAQAQITDQGIQIRTGQTDGLIPNQALDTLTGIHNRENAAAAALALLAAGEPLEDICRGMARFTMLPHRMAFVRDVDGISFFNDSKATNTDAVIRALESFENEIVLILGGREKDTDFSPLVPAVKASVKQIMAIGEATDHILETFETVCQVVPSKTMAGAVAAARDAALAGDVVLLSPACASFDMYKKLRRTGRGFYRLCHGPVPGCQGG